jgi:hypothetical protein
MAEPLATVKMTATQTPQWKVTTPSRRTKTVSANTREEAWSKAYKALGITWMPPGTRLERVG